MEVRDGSVVVDVGSKRHREVLAALVLDAGRVVSTESLLDRVWGEGQRGATKDNLHAVISRLRSKLPAAAGIATQDPGYRLDLPPGAVDAEEFTSLVADARRLVAEQAHPAARSKVEAALALWRGRPYADIRASFAEIEADRLEGQRLSATELLAELDLAMGRHSDLLGWLAGAVAQHPLREGLRGSLMLALYRAGRQAEALEQYDEARTVLAEELGIDPGPDLQRLHALVLRQDPSLLAPPATPVPAMPRPTLPTGAAMVGRSGELARILSSVSRGLAGSPSFTAVVGEAGIGKTRLVEEVAAATDSAVVAWGRCWDHEGTPALWPWERALAELVDRVGLDTCRELAAGPAAAISALVPQLGDAPAAGVPRTQLYAAVVTFLEGVTDLHPVLMVLEDLHWGDRESVELAEYVATAMTRGRLALVVTVRNPSESRGTAGDDLIAAVAREPQSERVDLVGLGVDDVRTLVEGRTGTGVSPDVARALRDRTDGNPFYLCELTRLLGEEREISGRADVPVPVGVRAVIERRLRHLPTQDQSVLAVASVIGRSFEIDLLAEITALPTSTLVGALDRAVQAGVLSADPHRGRFAHALVQETLALSGGPMRRAALHGQVAEALERRESSAPAAIAFHYISAGAVGDPEKAVRFSLEAAAEAERRLAYHEAERNVRQAIDQLPLLPGAAALSWELEARVRLGSLLSLRLGYNVPEVAEERRRALELSELTGSREHLFSALWGTWGTALVSADFVTADGLCDQMTTIAGRSGDDVLLLAAHHARGQVRWHQGRLDEARAELERAVVMADERCDQLRVDLFLQHPSCAARGWLAIVLAMQGERELSDTVSAEAVSLAAQFDHPFTTNYVDVLRSMRAAWLGDAPEAARVAGQALETARTHGFVQLEAFALLPAGWATGKLQDAAMGEEILQAALAGFRTLPYGYMFGHLMLALIAELRLERGDLAGALTATDEALVESERTGERLHLAEVYRVRALALEGKERRAALDAAMAVAREQGARLFEERSQSIAP
jgi:predicted ATPase/DNA-binding SARP family transcriptional activator